ncbi:MAG TPA: lactonase family protein [Beutenbergiaceae bacterium]|nr:lactonase family protein [Beutenbergiaceae bacterium]
MTAFRHIWIGTGAHDGPDAEGIWRMDRPAPGQGWGARPATRVLTAERPTYLALHPSADRLYAVSEGRSGAVVSYTIGADCALGKRRKVATGGVGPCHLRVHPQGQWLYVSNYGDGTLSAVELTEAGDVSERVLTYRHSGSGPDRGRQESSHAHSATLSPGGEFLIVADLGTDELRAYPLENGRPDSAPVLTTLPPGTGPRHLAIHGDYLYVTGELSGEVLVLAWNEQDGSAELIQRTPAATLPGRSADAYYLSHILIAGGVVLIASRGSDSLSTFTIAEDGAHLELTGEVPTAAWPRHMAVVGSQVLVAGEREDVVVAHPFTPGGEAQGRWSGAVGPEADRVSIPTPMYVLPM